MPSVTDLGFSKSLNNGVEALGFSNTHRREPVSISEQLDTMQDIPDLGWSGEKIEDLNVSKLRAGELSVDQFIRSGQTDYDTGTGFWLGDDSGTAKLSIGNSAGNKLTWDGSTLAIVGSITATTGAIGGWVITSDTLYSLSSGTPSSAPNNGLVLDSSNPVITVYEGTAKRVELGYLSASVFGLKGYATNGSTVIFELSDTQQKIAGWTFTDTQLSSGSVIINSANEQILMGSATTPTSGEGIFIGKSGSTYHLRAGNPSGDQFYWNPDDATGIAVAQITHRMIRQVGWDVTEGEIVAVESDGKLYPTRVSGITSTTGTDTFTISDTVSRRSAARITSRVVFMLYKPSSLVIRYHRILINDTFTDIETLTDGNVTAGLEDEPNVIAMTTTSAMGCYQLSGSTTVYARMFTGLDTTVTTNTAYSIDTDAGVPFLARVSDTQALMVYREQSSSDLKIRKLDLSGTVITAGSETAVYTATSLSIYDFVRFGTSEYYAVIFNDNGTHYAICIQWNGTTFTVGSAVALTTDTALPTACSMDSTRIAVTGLHTSDDIMAQVVSRSGTTLTANTALDVAVTTDAPSGTVICPLGADSFGLFFAKSTSTAALQLVRADDVSLSELGSEVSVGRAPFNTDNNNSNQMNVVKITPAVVMTVATTSSNDMGFAFYAVTNNFDWQVGVTTATAAADAETPILMNDYSANFTGLATATRYYVDCDGAITTEDYAGLSPTVGVALSSTEMDIQI